jgi:hypothetical protein
MTAPTYCPHPALKPLADIPRVDIERKICRRTIRDLISAGFALRVHSGEEWETPKAATETQLMRALFNLDDAWLVVFEAGKRVGWVRFVFGNCGWDVMSDYTTNLAPALKDVEAYADAFDADAFDA